MIVDLSALEATDKGDYVHRLRFAAEAHREAHGFPHWVIYDEAHLLGPQEEARWVRRGGYVLSSYVHAELPADEVSDSDVILEMGPDRWASIRVAGGEPKPFTPDRRRTLHIRHRHKYAQVALPKERRFYFRSAGGQSLPPAATMPEFRAAVSRLDPEALEFHLERGLRSLARPHRLRQGSGRGGGVVGGRTRCPPGRRGRTHPPPDCQGSRRALFVRCRWPTPVTAGRR